MVAAAAGLRPLDQRQSALVVREPPRQFLAAASLMLVAVEEGPIMGELRLQVQQVALVAVVLVVLFQTLAPLAR